MKLGQYVFPDDLSDMFHTGKFRTKTSHHTKSKEKTYCKNYIFHPTTQNICPVVLSGKAKFGQIGSKCRNKPRSMENVLNILESTFFTILLKLGLIV